MKFLNKLIQHRRIQKAYRYRVKRKVIEHYSNETMQCADCGISDIRVLSIDHISGGGNKHRKKIGKNSGLEFWQWLIKNNFPEGYQVLCMNCQWIKRYTNREVIHKNKNQMRLTQFKR